MDKDIRKIAKALDYYDTRPLGIGNTSLHLAAMKGRTDLTRMFLSTSKVNINVNVNNRMESSPIVCAFIYNYIEGG